MGFTNTTPVSFGTYLEHVNELPGEVRNDGKGHCTVVLFQQGTTPEFTGEGSHVEAAAEQAVTKKQKWEQGHKEVEDGENSTEG